MCQHEPLLHTPTPTHVCSYIPMGTIDFLSIYFLVIIQPNMNIYPKINPTGNFLTLKLNLILILILNQTPHPKLTSIPVGPYDAHSVPTRLPFSEKMPPTMYQKRAHTHTPPEKLICREEGFNVCTFSQVYLCKVFFYFTSTTLSLSYYIETGFLL